MQDFYLEVEFELLELDLGVEILGNGGERAFWGFRGFLGGF